MLLSCLILNGQEVHDTLTVYFHKESAVYNSGYRSNDERLNEFSNRVNAHLKASAQVSIHIESIGTSSPEGDTLFNRIISDYRGDIVKRKLLNRIDIPSDSIKTTVIPEDWEGLIRAIESDPRVTNKDAVISVLNSRADYDNNAGKIINELLKIEYSRPYWYIYHNIFPLLRACRVTAIVDLSGLVDEVDIDEWLNEQPDIEVDELEGFIPLAYETVPQMHTVRINGHIVPVTESTDIQALTEGLDRKGKLTRWVPNYKHHVKTNGVGWLLGAANVAYEYDFSDRLSLSVPFYYSGLNYFRKDLKFRVCTLQPELRYHFAEGLFAGVHAGVGWYNLALLGDYRIQSRGGSRPAIGGGVSVGYRMSFKYIPHLGIEMAMGAGVYDARYDRFYNVPNGAYAARDVQKTFVGIDNLSVSLIYNFDFKKEERR